MDQLICHLVGDYVLQTDWMARNKTSNFGVALIHALVYAAPFALITGATWAWVVIFGTHVVIDRYRLANLVMRVKQWSWHKPEAELSAPPEVRTMLMIVIDNTIHLTINFLAIKYLS